MFKLLRRMRWTKSQPTATPREIAIVFRDVMLIGLAALGVATLWFMMLLDHGWNAEHLRIAADSARDVWVVSVIVGIYWFVWRDHD